MTITLTTNITFIEESFPMNWSDEYATGIEKIDGHHKMIFKMAGDFKEALDQGRGFRVYPILLQSLTHYVRNHFAVEEKCMEKYGCPRAAENKAAHDKFEKALCLFSQRLEKDGYSHEDASELVDTIDNWLGSHICKVDLQLKQHAP